MLSIRPTTLARNVHSLKAKIENNRHLKLLAVQRRHFESRLKAVLGHQTSVYALHTQYRCPGGAASLSSSSSSSVATAAGTEEENGASSIQLLVPLSKRCSLCIATGNGGSAPEAEEMAVGTALLLFPTVDDWAHVMQVADSSLFVDINRTVAAAGTSLVATLTRCHPRREKVPRVPGRDLLTGYGAAYVVTIRGTAPGDFSASDAQKVNTTSVNRASGCAMSSTTTTTTTTRVRMLCGGSDDTAGGGEVVAAGVQDEMVIGRGCASNARDALKVAMLDSLSALDRMAKRECTDCAEEAERFVVEDCRGGDTFVEDALHTFLRYNKHINRSCVSTRSSGLERHQDRPRRRCASKIFVSPSTATACSSVTGDTKMCVAATDTCGDTVSAWCVDVPVIPFIASRTYSVITGSDSCKSKTMCIQSESACSLEWPDALRKSAVLLHVAECLRLNSEMNCSGGDGCERDSTRHNTLFKSSFSLQKAVFLYDHCTATVLLRSREDCGSYGDVAPPPSSKEMLLAPEKSGLDVMREVFHLLPSGALATLPPPSVVTKLALLLAHTAARSMSIYDDQGTVVAPSTIVEKLFYLATSFLLLTLPPALTTLCTEVACDMQGVRRLLQTLVEGIVAQDAVACISLRQVSSLPMVLTHGKDSTTGPTTSSSSSTPVRFIEMQLSMSSTLLMFSFHDRKKNHTSVTTTGRDMIDRDGEHHTLVLGSCGTSLQPLQQHKSELTLLSCALGLSNISTTATTAAAATAAGNVQHVRSGFSSSVTHSQRVQRQNSMYCPDLLVLIQELREVLGQPQTAFPSVAFTQLARHDPQRRIRQLQRGHSGDVDVYTRVTVEWREAEGHMADHHIHSAVVSHGKRMHLAEKGKEERDERPCAPSSSSLLSSVPGRSWRVTAESKPQRHMKSTAAAAAAPAPPMRLEDTGYARGPLKLLLAAVCELHARVMAALRRERRGMRHSNTQKGSSRSADDSHDVEESLPLISVRDPSTRAGLDFLMYAWFGATPQVRLFTIASSPYVKRQNCFTSSSCYSGSACVEKRVRRGFVRAMLFYDFFGQRVLFAETHALLAEAAVARVGQLAVMLNMPDMSWRWDDCQLMRTRFSPHTRGGAATDEETVQEGIVSQVVASRRPLMLRAFRSVGQSRKAQQHAERLRRWVATIFMSSCSSSPPLLVSTLSTSSSPSSSSGVGEETTAKHLLANVSSNGKACVEAATNRIAVRLWVFLSKGGPAFVHYRSELQALVSLVESLAWQPTSSSSLSLPSRRQRSFSESMGSDAGLQVTFLSEIEKSVPLSVGEPLNTKRRLEHWRMGQDLPVISGVVEVRVKDRAGITRQYRTIIKSTANRDLYHVYATNADEGKETPRGVLPALVHLLREALHDLLMPTRSNCTSVFPHLAKEQVHKKQRYTEEECREATARCLAYCRDAQPVLLRDGYPSISLCPEAYHAPRLLGDLLQGIAGKYYCTYRPYRDDVEQEMDDYSDDGSGEGDEVESARAVDEKACQASVAASASASPKTVFYSSETATLGARELADRVSASSLVLCTLWIPSTCGHRVQSLDSQPEEEHSSSFLLSSCKDSKDTSDRVAASAVVHKDDGVCVLGVGVGGSQREAWRSAAWHALRFNFPDLVEATEARKRRRATSIVGATTARCARSDTDSSAQQRRLFHRGQLSAATYVWELQEDAERLCLLGAPAGLEWQWVSSGNVFQENDAGHSGKERRQRQQQPYNSRSILLKERRGEHWGEVMGSACDDNACECIVRAKMTSGGNVTQHSSVHFSAAVGPLLPAHVDEKRVSEDAMVPTRRVLVYERASTSLTAFLQAVEALHALEKKHRCLQVSGCYSEGAAAATTNSVTNTSCGSSSSSCTSDADVNNAVKERRYFDAWEKAQNYNKSVWHAYCGALGATLGGRIALVFCMRLSPSAIDGASGAVWEALLTVRLPSQGSDSTAAAAAERTHILSIIPLSSTTSRADDDGSLTCFSISPSGFPGGCTTLSPVHVQQPLLPLLLMDVPRALRITLADVAPQSITRQELRILIRLLTQRASTALRNSRLSPAYLENVEAALRVWFGCQVETSLTRVPAGATSSSSSTFSSPHAAWRASVSLWLPFVTGEVREGDVYVPGKRDRMFVTVLECQGVSSAEAARLLWEEVEEMVKDGIASVVEPSN